MGKVVRMQDIKNAFIDLDFVDFVTVSEITDSIIYLKIHVKNNIKNGSDSWKLLESRCEILGDHLGRKIYFKVTLNNILSRLLWYISTKNF